jgi:hypothetical protein
MAEEQQRGDETPEAVQRLLGGRAGEAYLDAHHAEAARRLARLFGRARMMQRVTMSYDPARAGGSRQRPQQVDLADSAAEARRTLAGLARAMPRDCWDILTDVCGFDKGLQLIEADRNWPRRSAKLVLRISLDQAAALFGLSAYAAGHEMGRIGGWLQERPPMFRDDVNDI